MAGSAEDWYRRAWWSLALFPISLIAAFLVGEGLFTLLDDGAGDAPPWVVLTAGLPALVIFAAPTALALRFGRRAADLGRAHGNRPAVVALAISVAFVALNAVSLVVTLLTR